MPSVSLASDPSLESGGIRAGARHAGDFDFQGICKALRGISTPDRRRVSTIGTCQILLFGLNITQIPFRLQILPPWTSYLKSNLFLLKEGRYHPTTQVSANGVHLSVTFSKEVLPRKPTGEQVRILLLEADA